MTIFAPPEKAWDALSFLCDKLTDDLDLKVNQDKCSCYGTTPEACAEKPDWLKEPLTYLDKAGSVLVEGRGISVCNCPIGESSFVNAFLTNKFKDICGAIEKSSKALSSSSSHADFLAFYHSYQARFDYWLSTHNLVLTDPLAAETDEFLRRILSGIAGFDIFEVPATGTPICDFVTKRSSLKVRDGGLGFRCLTERHLLLNSLNNTMPQAIDRTDIEGNFHKGLWNSLSDVLGVGSFDAVNADRCWTHFHESDCSLAKDHLVLIKRVKERRSNRLLSIGIMSDEEDDDPIFSASPDCFGFGTKKLHKAIQDKLRCLDYEVALLHAKEDLAGEDQRRLAFVAAHDNKFANAFPLALAPSETVRFNNFEFTVAIARKLGLPIPALIRYVGTFIKTEKGSPRMRVDPFGNNITTATGVKGGHVTQMHNAFSRALMTEAKSVVPSCKGTNAFDTCNGVFGKCLQREHILEEIQERILQGELQRIIPDGIVDATGLGDLQPFNSDPNPLAGVATLVETKTLASVAQSPDERAEKFQRDVLRRVRKLDADFPGSTFERTLKSYGNNGRYLVLVDGPFSNLSKDVGVLTDLIARLRALRLLNQWDVSAKQALALNRNFWSKSFVTCLPFFSEPRRAN